MSLTELMFAQFHDPERGGFFQTGVDHEALVVRRKDFIDNAIPSGNSLAAESLLRLAELTGHEEWRSEATRILLAMKEAMAAQPTGFGRMLCALDMLLAPRREIAIIGAPDDAATQALLRTVQRRHLPNTVLAVAAPDAASDLPPLAGRTLVDGQPAAYVCENYACNLPVTTPEELAALLGG
ncbi:MAG: hypothetical protein R2854_00080 [Caldilineaceae bacterium]